MHKQIFVSLPVADLQKTRAFFTALGFRFDPRFSNDDAVGMVIGENVYAMLLTRPFYQTFTDKKIADTKEFVAAAICLTCESRQEVDDLAARAREAGGKLPRPPKDYGTMYSQGFEDLDGHNWKLMHMESGA
jgi:predicted lactoylglutathione lyase